MEALCAILAIAFTAAILMLARRADARAKGVRENRRTIERAKHDADAVAEAEKMREGKGRE